MVAWTRHTTTARDGERLMVRWCESPKKNSTKVERRIQAERSERGLGLVKTVCPQRLENIEAMRHAML